MRMKFFSSLFMTVLLVNLVADDYRAANDISFRELLEKKENQAEVGVELLVFTSTISPVFSDAQVLLDETFGTNNSAQVYKNVVGTIDSEYNAGFSLYCKYHPSQKMSTIGLSYSYIHSDGDGHLNQNNSTYIPITNVSQNVLQKDKGSQHTHLHIVDFTIEKSLPITQYFLINLQAGMAFHSFHYSFGFHNKLSVTQTSDFGGGIVGIQDVDAKVSDKENFYGVGPKVGVQFDFPLLSPSSSHDLNFVGLTSFGLICVRDSSHGKLSIDKQLVINGDDTGSNSSTITWKNPSTNHFIPNINLDFQLQYQWHNIRNSDTSLILALGYRFI